MEPLQKELIEILPSVAAQMRGYLSNMLIASRRIATAQDREADPVLDAKASILDQSFYQMLRLADNLTDAGYITGAIAVRPRPTDLVALVDKVCHCAGDLAELIGLKLRYINPRESFFCAVDATAIEKLLYHLLSNAMKFTPQGGEITVELKITGGLIRLTVSDTGRGIPEELLPTLFDRFLHTDRRDPIPHGLGLGLPICRAIAERHKGTILAESKPGKGSRFIVSIPVCEDGCGNMLSDYPAVDISGGLNPALRALADAMPPRMFLLRYEE